MKKWLLITIIVAIFVIAYFIYFNFFVLTGDVVEGFECSDSDNGKEFYIVGETTGRLSPDADQMVHRDFCFNTTDYANKENFETYSCKGYQCSVQEHYCGFKDLAYYVVFLCQNGCVDGRCLSSTEDYESLKNPTETIPEPPKPSEPSISIPSDTEGPSALEKLINFLKKLFSK